MQQRDKRVKGTIFKNCAPSTKCISEINNKQVDDAQEIDAVMPMYNLIEYSDTYLTTSESLWQYYRDESNDIFAISESFKFNVKKQEKPPMMVVQRTLKYQYHYNI